MSDQWFYYHNNKQEGPMPLEKIRELVLSGQLQKTSYVWTKGFSDWKLVSFNIFSSAVASCIAFNLK